MGAGWFGLVSKCGWVSGWFRWVCSGLVRIGVGLDVLVGCHPLPTHPMCCFCFAVDPAPHTYHFGSRPYLVVPLSALPVFIVHITLSVPPLLAYWTLLQIHSHTTTRYQLCSGIRYPWQWVSIVVAELVFRRDPNTMSSDGEDSWKPIQVLAVQPATLKRR